MTTIPASVSERLVAFLREGMARGVPPDVATEAKRLLLNQLKASVAAIDHPAVKVMHDWAVAQGRVDKPATVLWLGTPVAPAQAAVVNGALFEVLDFHDTYIPCFMHAVSGVLPALLAAAEVGGHSGKRVVDALALGLEAELAVATILMPTGYYRGYVPAGLTGGVGAAAACAALAGLSDEQTRNALGIAMCTAFGLYVSVGSDTLSYITGATARSGYTAFELAARGMTAPVTAFEGEKGMFVTHTDEKPDKIAGVMDGLGRDVTGKSWRIFGQSYKTVPTETITHAPIELALEILKRARGRAVAKMTFGVEQIVVKIVKERNERFGLPKSDLEARFDLRYCAAAAWVRGRFTLAEMQRPAYTDPEILAMRDKIELVADPARKTFEGAWLEVMFADGSVERANVDNFLGTPGNRMSDTQLSDVFRVTAADHMPKDRIEALLAAVWGLEQAKDVRGLMTLARTGV
ncbi:MAG: MmgE/PrpD family protein [Rhodospirillaceae bacterium]|nr:MmgE/PrpD family protein [Rhodospirillaceae bacterium]